MPKFIIAFLTCVLFVSPAQADTLPFGPTGGPPVAIPGTNDGSGGLITYSSILIQGGDASPSTHGATSGTITDSLGSATLFDGTYFDPAVDGDPTLSTRIASTIRGDIDSGSASNYGNYIGFCVQFSAPIDMYSFGFVDMDGNLSTAENEWAGSFAYNSSTSTSVAPAVTLGDTTNAGLAVGTPVNWSGLTGAPSTSTVAFSNAENGNLTPNDPIGQVTFDYGGAQVTDVYFLFGLQGDWTGNQNANNNSGVTGFTVIEPANIPEPSAAMLLGFGTLLLVCRRKKSELS